VRSPGAFKSSYTVKHQSLFLDQAFSLASSGFVSGSTAPDPNFPKCFQCAAIDRARLKTSPTTPRSDFCTQCFQQYCFDPANPPTAADIPGRKMAFVDPDPQALSKAEAFFIKNKIPLAVGLGLIPVILVGLCVFWCVQCRHEFYDLVH
jgi:lysophospholipase